MPDKISSVKNLSQFQFLSKLYFSHRIDRYKILKPRNWLSLIKVNNGFCVTIIMHSWYCVLHFKASNPGIHSDLL